MNNTNIQFNFFYVSMFLCGFFDDTIRIHNCKIDLKFINLNFIFFELKHYGQNTCN